MTQAHLPPVMGLSLLRAVALIGIGFSILIVGWDAFGPIGGRLVGGVLMAVALGAWTVAVLQLLWIWHRQAVRGVVLVLAGLVGMFLASSLQPMYMYAAGSGPAPLDRGPAFLLAVALGAIGAGVIEILRSLWRRVRRLRGRPSRTDDAP